MPIRIEHSGTTIEVDTLEQAARLVDHLHRLAEMRAQQERKDEELRKIIPNSPDLNGPGQINPWTKEVFWAFVSRLNPSQKQLLTVLLPHGEWHAGVPDAVLREAIGANNNLVLAGVLSGISKQAKRLGLRPRDVFWFDTARATAGQSRARRSTYYVDQGFFLTALELGWPAEKTLEKQTEQKPSMR